MTDIFCKNCEEKCWNLENGQFLCVECLTEEELFLLMFKIGIAMGYKLAKKEQEEAKEN